MITIHHTGGAPTPGDQYLRGASVDGVVKITHFSFSVKGGTAGDIVMIREGGPTGAIKFVIPAAAANGLFGATFPEGGGLFKNPYISFLTGSGDFYAQLISA